jgi:hypothetical protein
VSITHDKIINARMLPLRYEGDPHVRGHSIVEGLAVVVAYPRPNADDVDADEIAARIRACVNACAGMKDPAAEIAALRKANAAPGGDRVPWFIECVPGSELERLMPMDHALYVRLLEPPRDGGGARDEKEGGQ